MREKLIELIFGGQAKCLNHLCHGCEQLADYLIDNGVTVQRWIPASEPPKDTCEYWIAYKAGGDYYYSTGYFDG